jgi:dTDP-glucose pyrophosphorylase
MQIIIPMSGYGERFRRAGYDVPKPLIQVESKPIIQHVYEMFPGESNFIFICNQDHINNDDYELEETITTFCPTAKIVSIEPHNLGPVHAVLASEDLINDDEQTIVNYCDFTCYWDYSSFKKYITDNNLDGAIPAYRGFHPHTLWSNYYAYLKIDNNLVTAIQEKTPFTKKPQDEYASSGTYFFKSGKLMKEYFKKCIDLNLKVNDEFYVSMVYEPMIANGLKVSPFELEHFMQWGTPRDLEDYKYWSDIFKNYNKNNSHMPGTLLMSMAGRGSRFAEEGYTDVKPLINVSNKPMAVKAYQDLPRAKKNIAVIRNDQENIEELIVVMQNEFHDLSFCNLDNVTDGQAVTCAIAIEEMNIANEYLTISACDNGIIYNKNSFQALMEQDIDIIVWAARSYPGASRNPNMYGWLQVNVQNEIIDVSVKKPFSNPDFDPIIVGTFTFKNPEVFMKCYTSLKNRKGLVNGEYYVDSMIKDALSLGLNCKVFEIDKYICWGTPNDLKTYEYWESCFSKWSSHPFHRI